MNEYVYGCDVVGADDGEYPDAVSALIKAEKPMKAERAQALISYAMTALAEMNFYDKEGESVAWRDDVFRRPITLRDREGRVKKRTVLMEMPDENAPAGGAKKGLPKQERPPGLSDAQVRALDRADEARANGLITEPEYQKRRRLILENRLEEAGEAPDAETAPP